MDKVNLPDPEAEGPNSYDNSILLFEHSGSTDDGIKKFRVAVGDEADLEKWKEASLSEEERTMKGGRRFGVLF
jgi:hypothetical protein